MNRTAGGSRNLAKVLPLLIITAVLGLAWLAGQPRTVPFRRPFLILAPAVAGLLILMQRPGLGLVALAALSFTLPFTFGTGSEVRLTPPVFLIAGIAAAWFLTGMHRRSGRLAASRTLLPLLLFVASGLLSLLAGRTYWDPLVPQPGNLLLVQLGQWGLFALSAAIFVLASDLGQHGRWLELAVWTFLTVGSVVVLELFLPSRYRPLGWSKWEMANRSMFWTWLAALGAGQFLFNRSLRPMLRAGLMALLAAAAYVVWFKQRDWVSGWVPFTVAFSVVLWMRVWRANRVAGLILALVLVASAVAFYQPIFQHAGGEKELDISWGGRKILYQATLDLVKEHPILGLGPAAYRQYGFSRWLSLGVGRALWIRPNISSHNNYIDIYAQQGLVGLALFLWFLGEVGLLGWRLGRRFKGDFEEGYVLGVQGGLVGTLVAMMLADWFLPFVYNVGFPGFRTSALAWMFLGGLVALEAKTQQGSTAEADRDA